MPEGWEFAGLTTSQVLTVAGVGAAIVVGLFLLRPRPPVLDVSSHVLWDKVLPKRSNPLAKELLMLLMQLLAVAALAVALGEPRRVLEDEESSIADGVVLDRLWVVDRSLSMGAVDEDGDARIDRVAELLREELLGLDERVRVGIVGASATPELQAPCGTDRERVGLALRMLDVDGVRADLRAALELATSQPGVRREVGLVELVTDAADAGEIARRFETDTGWRVVIRSPFAPRNNLVVTAFDLRASEGIPAEEEAVVRLANRSPVPAQALLRLETVDAILGEASVTLAPGEEIVRRYRFQPLDAGGVEAVLRDIVFEDGTHDGLAADDRAYAWIQPVHPVRALLVTDGNRYLERVLALLPGADLDVIRPKDWSQAGAPRMDGYDVVFLDGFVPDGRQPKRAFYVDPPAGAGPFRVERRVATPSVTDWNHDHPVFRGLVLRDLQVQESSVLAVESGDVRLIGSPTGALAVARQTDDGRAIGWGFDFARSDLPLRLAFPQTIVNALLWMRSGRAVGEEPGGRAGLAEPFWVGPDGPEGARPRDIAAAAGGDGGDGGVWIELTDLGRRAVALARGDERAAARASRRIPVGDGPVPVRFAHAGLWRLEGPTWERDVAVNLWPSSESLLVALPSNDEAVVQAPAAPVDEEPQERGPLWLWLGIGVGALLLTEFGVYAR